MTPLGKLFRTTAFKLSLAYLLLFGVGAFVVLGSVGWNVRGLFDAQIADTVEAEITGLSEQYAQGGIRRLVETVERRAREPGSSLYLVTSFTGETLTGNIETLPKGVLDHPGLIETTYSRAGDTEALHLAVARIFALPGGFRLIVGRDLTDREALRRILNRVFVTSLLALTAIATLGGLFVAQRVLQRVDGMNATAFNIMQGDLSQRLPQAGTGDELDRLADNLNRMLDRISELMTGLRDVSDNIAHDLKTPLTRLRNGAEQAMRPSASPGEHRQALEHIIDEADGLIRVFNALLQIARTEAGQGREGMTNFDVGTVAQDVGELYGAVAEETGGKLSISAEPNLYVHGSRELIGQAVANLIDNALKYGHMPLSSGDEPYVKLEVVARRHGPNVEISIADTGPGIAEADRTHVQQRFVRLAPERSQPGSGLGLSLVAAVARLHRGSLTLEDNKPGLKARLSLPSVPAPILAIKAT